MAKEKEKIIYRSRNMHFISMGLMLLGFVMIFFNAVAYLTGHNIGSNVALIGIIIGIIGVFLNKRNMK